MADRAKHSEFDLDLNKLIQKYKWEELEEPEALVHNDVFSTKEFNKLLQTCANISPNPSKSWKHFSRPNPTLRRKELQVKRRKTMLKYHIRSFMPVLPVIPLAKCSSHNFKSRGLVKLKQKSNYQQIRRSSALPVGVRFDKSLENEIGKFFVDATRQLPKSVWFNFKTQDLPNKIVSHSNADLIYGNEDEEAENADQYETFETEEPALNKIQTENTPPTFENKFESSTTVIYPIQRTKRIQIEREEMQDLPIFPTVSAAPISIPKPVQEDDDNQWTDLESDPESLTSNTEKPYFYFRRALKQTKLGLKNNRLRHYRPEIEESTEIESEYDDDDDAIGNGDAVITPSSIQTKLKPVVIPSNRSLYEYHNYLCALPIPAFLQNEMESKAERVFINGFEHLKEFLNFVREKYTKPSNNLDPSYTYNLEALIGEEDLMIRHMKRRKPKHLKVQDILDRYDTLLTVMPVNPMKNLFYIHMKEFMRKFPAENYVKIKTKTRSKKLRPNRASGVLEIEDLPIPLQAPVVPPPDVPQNQNIGFFVKLKVNLLGKLHTKGRNCLKN